MNGILIINKPYGCTSRDIVNIIGKKFKTRKAGHTGTLDPIATGVLVVPLGKALKISELLTAESKEYVARVILGYETDMLDITGKVIKKNTPKCEREDILRVLNSFIGKSRQKVPLYSAVKVNGKKLYEYARSNLPVEVPEHEIFIQSIDLVGDPVFLEDTIEFTMKCNVSKGTYIRGLIRDIGYKLNTYGTMKELTRTRQGEFTIDMAYSMEDIENGKYKVLRIRDALPNMKIIKVEGDMLKRIKNGQVLDSFFDEDMVLLVDNDDNEIAIYRKCDGNKVKPYKMLEVE